MRSGFVLLCALSISLVVASERAAGVDATQKQPFELAERQRLTFAGFVIATENATQPGIDFGHLPTRPMYSKTWLNPFTNGVEQRIYPAILHPIPVLRGARVRVYKEKPDLSKVGLDDVQAFGSEANLSTEERFALIGDDAGTVRLLSLTTIALPEDKIDQWRLAGTIENITLAKHVDDPVADKGRAVMTDEPLPLKGRLIYGTRAQAWERTTFHAIALPDGKPQKFAEATDGRMAANGTLIDKIDTSTLRITDKDGKLLREIKAEVSEFYEFAISADGQRVAFTTERQVEVPNDWPTRELTTYVQDLSGKQLAMFSKYDDAAFMPNGNLVLTGTMAGPGLFIGDVATGKVTPLLIKEGPASERDSDGRPGPEWPRSPVVSPDGKWVAYQSGRDVYVVGIDGTGWTPVYNTPNHEPQSSPAFSPDSQYIAMIVVPLTVMNGPGELSVFDIKKHVRQAIPAAEGANSDIPMIWTP